MFYRVHSLFERKLIFWNQKLYGYLYLAIWIYLSLKLGMINKPGK